MATPRKAASSRKKPSATRSKKTPPITSKKSTASKSRRSPATTSSTKHAAPPKKNQILLHLRQRIDAFRARRPHRTFVRTRRRDYVRSLKLPGYFAFTIYVGKLFLTYKKTFGLLIVVLAGLTGLLVGIASQDMYAQLQTLLNQTSKSMFSGGWGEVSKALLLLATGIGGNFSAQLTEGQQIYAFFLFLMTWLVTVWLLRAFLAGKKPRLRDGLYNAGAPIVATAVIALLLILQLVPIALAAIMYTAALATNLISFPLLSILVAIAGLLLIVLSLYLLVSSFFALIIVTLPGMYPWQALRTAGDLVIGRRLRILYRLAWLAGVVIVSWVVVMVPVILLATWLQTSSKAIAWVPIVPLVLLFLSTTTIVFCSGYIYLLYRKVIDDDTSPV